MPKDERPGTHLTPRASVDDDGVESHSLLAGEQRGNEQQQQDTRTPASNPPPRINVALPRQSSISLPSPDGQRRPPRTTNRVRFDLSSDHLDDDDDENNDSSQVNGHAVDPSRDSEDSWLEEEDYRSADGRNLPSETGYSRGQTLPLLTNIEAPSVTVATSSAAEEHLEEARPRSGMRMSFVNMANSIIGAGIIGQPYALRQAGVVVGTLLLIVLTITVDWTIRLMVVNSKLSGADSYQATMQHCFGKTGLISISIAQWVFAFGGMVAFCIIVGDTIPRVLSALIPSLRQAHFLWLLTDRRAMITLFTLTVSYPLSLYRDIAKVGPPLLLQTSHSSKRLDITY